MAKWNEGANWTPFDDINGGQQFANALTPEDLNKLAENIAYLYAHQGENEYLGAYAGGNYRAGAIVKYSDGNIYLCIKDTDDEQEPTNATYWQMLNTASGGETIPEFTEVEGFDVFLDEADEGTLTVAYSTPQDVKLPAPSGSAQAVRLASVDDENFIPSNIKKGVSIFGLTGTNSTPAEVSTEAEMTALLTSGEVGGVYKYTGTTGTYENGALYVLEEEAAASYNITVNNNTHYKANSDNPTQIKEGETVTLTFSSSELYSATASATNATCTYSTKAANSIRTLTVTLSNATDNVVVSIDAEAPPEPK